MKRQDFRHLDRLRVRWAEIDAQQIVFNGHYLMYIDTAVAGWWRALALPYAATMAAMGGDLFVRKATLEYHASARYDELLEVGIRCARIGNSSLQFSAAVFRGDALLVAGELVYVFADPQAQSSKPVPTALRDMFLGFEAGEPMLTVRCGGWAELGAAAGAIRNTVFVDEQKVPAEMEYDAADATCLHAVAFNRLDMPLATGRLLADAPGVARIGRMAVLPGMRGVRVGRQVLDALLAAARERGSTRAVLDAQTSAAAFYARAGFSAVGAPFDEVGIAHIRMEMTL